jgi:uncharacterized membrane protein YcjF (UPF0283 family)
MSQRNPMNDRYQSEDRKGLTRKSAASLKPKSKAAASVRIETKTKTPQQKKAEKKAERAKQAELDREYYNPPTEEYKRLRKAWWILLIAAILCTALSWVARAWEPAWISLAALALAYVFIIAAFYVDFSKIRKCRRAYQAEMMASKSKKSAKADDKEKANGKEKASDKEKEAAAASDAASDTENNSIIARLRSKHTKTEGSSEAETTSLTDEKE